MRKRTTAALAGIGLLVAVGGWSANTATASAHTPEVAADCHGVTINLTGYQIKPATTHRVVDVPEHEEVVSAAWTETVVDSPAVPAHDAVPAVPAVYGERPVITPAVPATPGSPAVAPVTHVEYQWKHGRTTVWVAAGKTPEGKGWTRTGECRTVTDVPGKPAVPATPEIPAVLGEAPLITPEIPAQPATDAIPEVSHPVEHPAVTRTVPATYKDEPVAGDDEPNTVSITTGSADYTAHEDHSFGTSYSGSVDFEDSTVENYYTVDVVAFDDPTGENGWTRQFTGTVEPCEATTPPTTPPTGEPSTPPSGEPSTPAPSDGPTTAPTGSPTPTAGTTPPAHSSNGGSDAPSGSPTSPSTHNKPSSTTSAAPVAADTSGGTETLAYTGIDRGTMVAALLAAGLAAAFGAVLLIVRTRRRRAELVEDGDNR